MRSCVGWGAMGKTAGDKDSEHFGSAAAFQKSLFWYNGAMELDGVMALPPLMLHAHGSSRYWEQ